MRKLLSEGSLMNKSLILLLFLLAAFACHDEMSSLQFTDTGTLLGYDRRMMPCMVSNLCACPGGIFIQISSNTYRFLELPKNSNVILDGATKFPLKVKLNWEKSKTCPLDLIEIKQIALF